jgi:hypothetical protein
MEGFLVNGKYEGNLRGFFQPIVEGEEEREEEVIVY